ncbi:hypothetical protein OG232_26430 [Streptomyces sp. NBC_01411]|uniref:hypothetical protein n=1 Tax=Streptomyces sp. NBC_01411 TaxID=2903857 RepID=UPI00324A9552
MRVGTTVRRPASASTGFIGDLLKMFEASGWPGAPRYCGIDEEGREVLTYLEGHVAWEPQQPPAVYSDESLLRVTQLVREFHDLTAGTALAGSHEVVCHNDLAQEHGLSTCQRRLAPGGLYRLGSGSPRSAHP